VVKKFSFALKFSQIKFYILEQKIFGQKDLEFSDSLNYFWRGQLPSVLPLASPTTTQLPTH